MKYLYKLTGFSESAGEKSYDRKKRTFSLMVVGNNLADVLGKTIEDEKSRSISYAVYHNQVDSFEIETVTIEHATLVSEVHIV